LTVLGLDRGQWGELHFWISLLLLLLLVFHVFLHRSWILSVVKGASEEGARRRVTWFLVVALVFLVLILAPFFVTPKPVSVLSSLPA
jgi:hypothetical protein